MDFDDSPEEAAFRSEVRQWLTANAVPLADPRALELSRMSEDENVAYAREWRAKKASAGYVNLHWPKEYGGQESAMKELIFAQEEDEYATPRDFFALATQIGPTIIQHGSDEMKDRFLGRITRGEDIWCQLFSEPGAGSDLAGIRTRAAQDGDDWVINGQKVWTSHARHADWGAVVTRTDPTVPKHKGVTYFIVDMKSPGVEVRPIKQMNGRASFNEVFLRDVRIPDSNRLGDVGGGWGVIITTLLNERFVGGRDLRPDFDELFALVQSVEINGRPAIEDRGLRQQLADIYVRFRGVRSIQMRTITAMSKGNPPGPEASFLKYVNSNKWQEICSLGMDLQDMGGIMLDEHNVGANKLFQEEFLHSPALRIAGGTDEIMLNIVAERVLGLPPEMRADKNLAFNEIPTGEV